MNRYYAERSGRTGDRPVAYITSGAPVEVLAALDVLTVYPENYSALCGARGAAVGLCELAEADRYPADLCSYARGHLGASLDPDRAPLGGLPRPDMLVCCTNICGTVIKWYEALADLYDCPLFVLDVPFQWEAEQEAHVIAYIAAQIEALIEWVEEQAGRRLEWGRLVRTIERSQDAIAL